MAIEFCGDFDIATPRAVVFAVLSDVARFSPMLPTYQSHELRDDETSDVKVRVGVGKIRGTAVVNLQLTGCEEPVSATYSGKGKIMGGAFNLTAAFDLESIDASQTRVKWRGDLVILGKLASLAGGMLKPVAKKQIQQLIDAIQKALSPDADTAPHEQST